MKFQMASVASIKMKGLSLVGKSSNEGSIPVCTLTAKAALALWDVGSWCSWMLPAWFPQETRFVLLLSPPLAPPRRCCCCLGSLSGERPWGQEFPVTVMALVAQESCELPAGGWLWPLAAAQQELVLGREGGTHPGMWEGWQALKNHFSSWSFYR